ncbi:hypothetical protein F511_14099 [Dorcoceras hygrometricum]|uniref:Uncharacterized protein n=1 Tax=Dorcoceras hygrometricum TaxID=472368 RepID=A0A2Z7CJZ1_9LAMI|nr:hypothetical protein F511_14099 [Dorcoceras hygrometricum]
MDTQLNVLKHEKRILGVRLPKSQQGSNRDLTLLRGKTVILQFRPSPPPPPRAAAATAVFAGKIVYGQFEEENPFVLISSGLLVQPDEGVSDLVVDRIGDNLPQSTEKSRIIVIPVGARHKCQRGNPFKRPISQAGWSTKPDRMRAGQADRRTILRAVSAQEEIDGVSRGVTLLETGAWLQPESQGDWLFTVGGGRLRLIRSMTGSKLRVKKSAYGCKTALVKKSAYRCKTAQGEEISLRLVGQLSLGYSDQIVSLEQLGWENRSRGKPERETRLRTGWAMKPSWKRAEQGNQHRSGLIKEIGSESG